MKNKIKFYAHALLELLWMKKVFGYNWLKNLPFLAPKTVLWALREHEEFFVLFQRETLNASLGNTPVV